jgi:hypothetical protein
MVLPKLPDIGDIIGKVTGPVTDWVKNYLWSPISRFFNGLMTAVDAAVHHLPDLAVGIAIIALRVQSIFVHGPSFVAHWLVKGFNLWIDAIDDLLEDWVDKLWDEE